MCTINSVIGVPSMSGGLSSIVISGSGCSGPVSGIITCLANGNHISWGPATPNAMGDWTATIDLSNFSTFCPCCDDVGIDASCGGSVCPPFKTTLQCCWTINPTTSVGACDPTTGTVTVNFSADLTPPACCSGSLQLAYWFDPSITGSKPVSGSTYPCFTPTPLAPYATITGSYAYTPGSTPLSAKLVIISPLGCPEIDIPLPTLPSCAKCPSVTMTTPYVMCASDGKSAQIQASVTLDSSSATVSWQVPNPPSGSGSIPDSGTWDSSKLTDSTATYTYSMPPPAGGYTFTATITPTDTRCPTLVQPITVTPACEGGPPPPPPPSDLCGALDILKLLALAIGLLALYITVCSPTFSLAFAVLSGIFLGLGAFAEAIEAIFCPRPCGWWLLDSWRALLIASALAFYMWCCPALALTVGPVLFVSFGIAFYAWIRHCHVSYCEALKQLGYVVVTVLPTVIGYIILVPFFRACLFMSPYEAVFETLIAAVIGKLALDCIGSITPSRD